MLLLEVRAVGGAGPALYLDPEVTVVVGLSAAQRRALAELITAAIRGRADLVEGTVAAGGRVLQMAEWAELATSTSAPGRSLDPVAAARRADGRVADLRAVVEDARGRAAAAASGHRALLARRADVQARLADSRGRAAAIGVVRASEVEAGRVAAAAARLRAMARDDDIRAAAALLAEVETRIAERDAMWIEAAAALRAAEPDGREQELVAAAAGVLGPRLGDAPEVSPTATLLWLRDALRDVAGAPAQSGAVAAELAGLLGVSATGETAALLAAADRWVAEVRDSAARRRRIEAEIAALEQEAAALERSERVPSGDHAGFGGGLLGSFDRALLRAEQFAAAAWARADAGAGRGATAAISPGTGQDVDIGDFSGVPADGRSGRPLVLVDPPARVVGALDRLAAAVQVVCLTDDPAMIEFGCARGRIIDVSAT